MRPRLMASPPTVMIVDDATENIDVLRSVFGADYSIRPALNGDLALRLAAVAPIPDIILLDLVMPGIDGYTVMSRLRARPETADIPVIFITAVDDTAAERKGLELGAVDYIVKPFVANIVKAKVDTHVALRRARLALAEHNRRLQVEKTLVEDIIARLRQSPAFDDRYLRMLVSPLDNANGDMLLSAFAPDRRQLVLVGDVAGHGIPAAVCAPLISHVFYGMVGAGKSLLAIRDEIDRVLREKLPPYIFFAACLVEVSAERDLVHIWNAGMPSPLLRRGGGAMPVATPVHAPLGVGLASRPYGEATTVPVNAGNHVYLYSDGVTGVTAPDGKAFGVEGVMRFVERLDANIESMNHLVDELRKYQEGDELADDITLLELRI